MNKLLKIGLTILFVLGILYWAGPKVKAPDLQAPEVTLPHSLLDIEQLIIAEEGSTRGLKPDNHARIVWADTVKKQKTPLSILYLHGFTASQADGAPVHTEVAQQLNANLFLFRNTHHGVDLGDATMKETTADDLYEAAEKALAIANKLGDQVIIMGTSLGGSLALYLASKHPEVDALVLYAPGIKPKQAAANLIIRPWGYQFAKMLNGSAHVDLTESNPLNRQYWTTRFHIHGIMAAFNFIKHTMTDETFKKIKCPVFLGYWYKNEQEQDDQVAVSSMIDMFDKLGTPVNEKRKVAFPNAGNHVIGSYIVSQDYEKVEQETVDFLQEIF